MARLGWRRRRAFACLGVATALLAGCGAGAPDAAPANSAAPTPTVTPSPVRTATPHPSNSPRASAPATHSRTPPTRTRTHAPTAPPVKPPVVVPVGGSDDSVYVLGDSVLLGATHTLPAALVGWRVTMNCVGSRRLPQAISVLQAVRSRLGAVVVIQMGNNYIEGEDGSFASQIDRAMQTLRGVRRVVWVTVAERWPSRVLINRAIRAAASRWPTIRVADWAPVIATHPAYADDMLHLSPSGRLAIARLIAAAVGPAPR